jgi:hypothetical protein
VEFPGFAPYHAVVLNLQVANQRKEMQSAVTRKIACSKISLFRAKISTADSSTFYSVAW